MVESVSSALVSVGSGASELALVDAGVGAAGEGLVVVFSSSACLQLLLIRKLEVDHIFCDMLCRISVTTCHINSKILYNPPHPNIRFLWNSNFWSPFWQQMLR